MTTTVIHLVRHGEVHNPERIVYGRLPGYRLSAKGRAQVAATAETFRGHDIRTLYCSPLQRTQETAEPIAVITGLSPQIDESLIEAGNQFEGLLVRSWRSELWNPKHWPLLKKPSVPSWGEPYDVIASRMMRAISAIRDEVEGHEAVVVSHQLPIVCVQRTVRGQELAHLPWDRQCSLASVTSLVFEGDKVQRLVYAEPARGVRGPSVVKRASDGTNTKPVSPQNPEPTDPQPTNLQPSSDTEGRS